MNSRERIEEIEEKTLSPLAVFSKNTKGRVNPEEKIFKGIGIG